MSANILNINYQNPQPIKLEYKISNKLNKASHDGTQDRVFETYKKFNDKLAYAYVNAILDEVELGQYNVKCYSLIMSGSEPGSCEKACIRKLQC